MARAVQCMPALTLYFLVICTRCVLALEQPLPVLLPEVLVRGNRTRSIGISTGPAGRLVNGQPLWHDHRFHPPITLDSVARDSALRAVQRRRYSTCWMASMRIRTLAGFGRCGRGIISCLRSKAITQFTRSRSAVPIDFSASTLRL
jgi:hypothetical protein